MNFFRVGIIDFFGILCPGVLLFVNINILLFACNLNLWSSYAQASLGDNGLILFLLLFVICYLFGFVLRLISPDAIEIVSKYVFKTIFVFSYRAKRKLKKTFFMGDGIKELSTSDKNEKFKIYLDSYYDELIQSGQKLPKYFWIDEIYPYYYSLKSIYYKHMSPLISPSIITEKALHNKTLLNFWKIKIAERNQDLSILIFQAEAFVRFMSGSFWSLLLGIISGLILVINQTNTNQYNTYGFVLAITSAIIAYIILRGFKNQRRREVMILLDSIFIIKKNESSY